ncbi:hypothetical protein ACDX41_25555, partial [Citrobacter meridianamericanus]
AKRPSCSLCRKADNDALEFRGVRRHIAEWSELVECAGNPAAPRGACRGSPAAPAASATVCNARLRQWSVNPGDAAMATNRSRRLRKKLCVDEF